MYLHLAHLAGQAANQGGPSLPWHGRWGKVQTCLNSWSDAALQLQEAHVNGRSCGEECRQKVFEDFSSFYLGKRAQVRFNTAELIWRVLFLLRLTLPDPENSSLHPWRRAMWQRTATTGRTRTSFSLFMLARYLYTSRSSAWFAAETLQLNWIGCGWWVRLAPRVPAASRLPSRRRG